jgi:uncharacterized membrane protein YGL010W
VTDPQIARRDPKKQRFAEDFDIIIGLLGFWGLVLLAATVVPEVRGRPALAPALLLLVVVLAIWGTLRLRRGLPRRTASRPH